jgi:hypothetical protein
MRNIKRHFVSFVIIISVFTFGCNTESEIAQSNSIDKLTQIRQTNQSFNSGYAILSGDEVTLNGEFINVGHAFDFNADIHSNNKVILNGKDITVEGFVTYNDIIKIDGDNIRIIPAFNPENLPPHSKVSRTAVPNINIRSFMANADVVYNGDTDLRGKIDLGTQLNPVIIYVRGKVFISGEINGYGLIVAEDDVEVRGNLTNSSRDPDFSETLIITNKKFIVNQESTVVYASAYSREEAVINDQNALFIGSITSLSKVTLNDNGIEFRYKPLFADFEN